MKLKRSSVEGGTGAERQRAHGEGAPSPDVPAIEEEGEGFIMGALFEGLVTDFSPLRRGDGTRLLCAARCPTPRGCMGRRPPPHAA